MSTYGVNRALYLLHTDPDFLSRFRADAESATDQLTLTQEERTALARGDVGTLYRGGAHAFLLHGFVRHGLAGVDQDSYMAAVRKAARKPGTSRLAR